MIERNIYKQLVLWKENPNRKPLILKGARQVGKSFAVEEFSKQNFRKLHKINFQSNKKAFSIFEGDLESLEIIKKLEYLLNDDINILEDLVFFDEIQECPNALNSLKFFCEELKELAIIGAGSYLGIMKNESSFPVGKVDYLSMFPLTYEEFLQTINPKLYKFYNEIEINKIVDNLIHNDLLEVLFLYIAIGGMPEIVQNFIDLSKINPKIEVLNKIRKLQKNLLESYKSDFSKHSGVINSGHILQVFESITYQLSQNFDDEVDKFKFSSVISKQKGFDRIIGPLTWLSKARLVIKNYIVSNIEIPLKSNNTLNKFKVFTHDVGLLNAMLDTPIISIVDMDNYIGSYKGYIVENFVACELFAIFDDDLNCFEKGQSEIEFVVQNNNLIIPIEVKSSKKSRKAKSLDSYVNRYSPELAYKLSAQNYGYIEQKGYHTLPLYIIGKLFKLHT